MLTQAEITMLAERVSRTHDRCPADAKAQLHTIRYQHGQAAVVAVITQMRLQSEYRYREAMLVFQGLPPGTKFAQALAIKAAQNDPVAEGWTKINDTTYTKDVRR